MKFEDEYYGVDGARFAKDDNDVYAKKCWNGRYFDYFVRHAVIGPDAPHLCNPWGVNFRPGVDNQIMETHMGKRRYEYRRVSAEVFTMYKSFLETRNERYYRAAERAID